MKSVNDNIRPAGHKGWNNDGINQHPRLQFPDILSGREKEINDIIGVYIRVCRGASGLTLIAGSAGVGKSALVKNINDEVTKAGSLFVSGKADQYTADIPYQVYIEIVQMLVKRLLMLDDYSLASLKKTLTSSLEKDLGVIENFIPEMKFITGSTENNYQLEQGNSEVRFRNAFSVFLQAVSAQYNGLVIFIDDMHWADSATLNVIKHIIDESIPGLYVIGAYRDNELKEDHLIIRMINDASLSPGALHLVKLDSLEYSDVEQIIFETLKDGSPRIKKLAMYTFRKTGGNPFYLREFMQSLIVRGCLLYKNSRWEWDDQKSMTIPATDNVLVLLSDMMNTLPGEVLSILKTASCLGSSFSTELLRLITDIKHSTLSSILNRLENDNYIITAMDTGSCTFSHDKIREAAYESISEDQKREIHGRAGTMLLRLFGADTEQIFTIADHLNRADKTVIDFEELIRINLDAGLKAKNNFAYDAAISYLARALDLYNEAVINESRLKFTILNAYSECLYLDADYDKAEIEIFKAINLTDDLTEKADLYNRIIMLKAIQLKYDESVKIGLEAVGLFGIHFEADPGRREAQTEEVRSNLVPLLNAISVEDILDLPECKRPDINRATQLIKNISGSLYHLDDWKFAYLVHSEIIKLTLEHGVTIDSPEGFVGHAMISIALWNNINLGYKLGYAAWLLSDKYGYLSQLSNVGSHYGAYILYWKKHLKYSLEILNAGLNAGIKAGEYLFVGYSVNHIIFNRFGIGENLKLLLLDLDKDLIFQRKLKNELIYNNLLGLKIILSNLTGKTEDIKCFDLDDYSEHELLSVYDEKKIFLAHAVYALFKSFLLYLYDDYNGSVMLMKTVKNYSSTILGTFHIIEYQFYLALNLAALDHQNGGYRLQLNEIEMMFEGYAAECPENFSCRHQLLKAERARLENDISAAMSFYDKAVVSARENEFMQIEAIACERAGLFWQSMNKDDFAAIYIKRAYDLFGKWGAESKTELMKKQYPEILNEHAGIDELNNADILALLKYFNQMSRDIDINSLVKTVSDIMLQQSGADMFALVVAHGDKIEIQSLACINSGGIHYITPPDDVQNQNDFIPIEMINYIRRTDENVVVYNGDRENVFFNTPYIRRRNPVSAFCLRADEGAYKTIMYFENRYVKSDYDGVKKTLMELLLKQAAICIQNAYFINGNRVKLEKTAFVFNISGITKRIPYNKILYFSSLGRHTLVYTTDEVYDVPSLLKDIEMDLPQELFVRAHRQYIVNLDNIAFLKREVNGRITVHINESMTLPVGRSYSNSFREKFKQLIIE